MKIDIDFIEYLVKNVNLNMKPCDRSICKNKYQEFLNNCKTDSGRALVRDICKNTIYVRFEELKEIFLRLINYVITKHKKFNVFYNINSIGSENWLVLLGWDKLREGCQKIISDYRDINNDYPILFIDDCIYTGNKMCYDIDDIQYDYQCKNNKVLPNECISVVPFCGKNGYSQLKRDFKITLYVGKYVEMLEGYDEMYLYRRLRAESIPYPIYFDHKIANEFGSFPQIYNHIVKNKPSRECIEEIAKVIEDKKKFVYK